MPFKFGGGIVLLLPEETLDFSDVNACIQRDKLIVDFTILSSIKKLIHSFFSISSSVVKTGHSVSTR